MSAAALEQPVGQPTLLEAADLIADQLVGYRVEIIGSQIAVTPPTGASHSRSLTNIMLPFLAAGLHGEETQVLQAVGIRLPDGPFDYAVPDLAVVDGDVDEHHAGNNCYDPGVFRLVLEVTSTNHVHDLKVKPAVYASAGVPVHVIVDRKNRKVMVLTEPADGEYRVHAVHHPGQSFELPASVGAPVTLSVDTVLGPEK
ncbi:Uma2 family endonuclease [Kitasatospora indigofera]|uniref:Uma2 family endonuclease n=1 Tax=Kitasatospora indigofera TaxID=67307 RepID=UPI0033B76F7D